MTAVVEGPWDGSAFAGVRKSMTNSYQSEYKYEYPVKTSKRVKGILYYTVYLICSGLRHKTKFNTGLVENKWGGE